METTTLYPLWKQAVLDFVAEKFGDNDVVPRSWFETHFEIEPLRGTLTVEKFQERQFVWLANIESFRTELLQKHQIHLQTVTGIGYRVVPAREQTGVAQTKFERELRKEFRRAADTLKNVRVDELTDDQRRENTDAIAKLSMLRGMQRGVLE